MLRSSLILNSKKSFVFTTAAFVLGGLFFFWQIQNVQALRRPRQGNPLNYWSWLGDGGVDYSCPGGQGCECAGGGQCRSGNCASGGYCTEAGDWGDPCSADQNCNSGWCNGGVCGNSKNNGTSCTADRECSSANCQGGICQRPRDTIGAPCSGQSGCAAGFYCDRDNTCQLQRGAGSPCADRYDCSSGNCDKVMGICSDTPVGCVGAGCSPNGSWCFHDSNCSSGFCDNGVCRSGTGNGGNGYVQPTPTSPPPPPSCNLSCGRTKSCGGGLTCYANPAWKWWFNQGVCRNASCLTETDCVCAVSPPPPTPTTPPSTPTPTPTTGPTRTPTPTRAPCPYNCVNVYCADVAIGYSCPIGQVCCRPTPIPTPVGYHRFCPI